MKKLLMLFLLPISIFYACQKEEIVPQGGDSSVMSQRRGGRGHCEHEHNAGHGNKYKHLQFFLSGKHQKAWAYTTYIINGVDVTANIPTCKMDNIVIMTADGRYIEMEGETKCDSGDSAIHNAGIYTPLDKEYSKIFLKSPGLTAEIELTELTQNSLKVKFLDPAVGYVEFYLVPLRGNEEDTLKHLVLK